MTTETINAMADAIEEFDGVDPESGVELMLPGLAYAAYADNYSYELADFSEWRGDAEDNYQGDFGSDVEFAQETHEQTSEQGFEVVWPYTCIDWEYAARELMYDYFESEGFYFRNA